MTPDPSTLLTDRATTVAALVRAQWSSGAQRERMAAIEVNGRRLTGQELLERVDDWRDRLADAGVQPGSIVGISLARSVDQVCAIVAVLETGAAYVPLDPSYPVARRQFMVDDLALHCILGDHANALPDVERVSWVRPPARRHRDAPQRSPRPPAPVQPDSLAYVIYTSGSTGAPKGVRITHRNLVTFLDEWDGCVEPSRRGTWIALTSLSFDPSVVELLWTLARGWTVVFAPDRPAPGVVGDIIREHRISHLQCTPTRASMLLGEPADRAGLALLEQIVVGGEVLTANLASDLASLVPTVTNVYGPTETTVWAFAYDVQRDGVQAGPITDPVPIGSPLPGVFAEVIDAHGTPLPAGSIGEIVLYGDDVADGYHQRPERTEAHFTPMLVDGVPEVCYRTGDLGQIRPDGRWLFHGRNDSQIKISGHRIEPAEIESELLRDDRVAHAVVVARELRGTPRLLAYVQPALGVAASALDDDATRILSTLRERLPASHVPSLLVAVDAFPLTPSGKVDRGALPLPSPSVAEKSGSADGTPCDTELASRLGDLCGIWSSVLGKPVGPDDDFFELGGDSLAAVAIMAEVARRYGESLGLGVLLDAPTPRALLAAVDGSDSVPTTLVRLRQVDGAPTRLFLVHGAGGNVVNFVPLATHLAPEFEVFAFQANGVTGDGAQVDASVEAMADRYVRELRALQPSGPYVLGGYSDGGLIAWEMAVRLQALGETVERIILLDTPLPPGLFPERLPLRTKLWNVVRNFRDRQRPVAQWFADAVRAQRQPQSELSIAAEDLDSLPLIDVQTMVERAAATYVVSPLSIPTVLIRAAHTKPALWLDFRWRRHARGPFRVLLTPGDHLGMVKAEHGAAFAAATRLALRS